MKRSQIAIWALAGLLFALCLPQTASWAGGPTEGNDNEPSSTVHFRVGMFHVVRGEYEQAIESFSRAIELEPDFDEAFQERGNCHAALGQYAQALSDYARVIVLMPNYGRPYYQRALVYLAQGKPDAALSDLKVAVGLMPVVPELHLTLGDLYFARGQYEEALEMYTHYLELAGANAEAYVVTRIRHLVAVSMSRPM